MKDFTEFIKKYNKVPYEDVNSCHLCVYYSNDFNLWFDKEKFNWNYFSYALCEYCSDHFDKWFDKEKFEWENSYSLCYYCSEQFDLWFDKELFDWEYSCSLCQYCSEHFDKWFDKELFNWKYYSNKLFVYCSKHLTKELIWECRNKIQWKEVDKRKIKKSIKMKLKIAGYL